MKKNNFYIMPMAGVGNRFKKEGYKIPKPLLKVGNMEMFLRSSKSFQKKSSWIFVLQKNIYKNKYVELIKKNFKKPVIIFLKKKTDGQARTVYKAKKFLTNNSSIYISSCDLFFKYDKKNFNSKIKKNDLIIFVSKPSKFNLKNINNFGWINIKKNKINRSACKKRASNNPKKDWIIIGSFVFKNKKIFDILLQSLFKSNLKINNEFYLDSCINIALKLKLRVSFIKVKNYISWGTPKELNNSYF
tara:strand:- start:631 stop:1365 length:735 start_codon:yes stop_codon:yes gene_type:complete